MITDLATAEMTKYASNAMLATRISFMNEIAAVCEQFGADVTQVARGMGYDTRIGPSFLNAGLGYGGSCFPKDIKALIHFAARVGCDLQLLRAVENINRAQRDRVVDKLSTMLGGLDGRSIGLLGLAFKPRTDDLREAPSIEIAGRLLAAGAVVSHTTRSRCRALPCLSPASISAAMRTNSQGVLMVWSSLPSGPSSAPWTCLVSSDSCGRRCLWMGATSTMDQASLSWDSSIAAADVTPHCPRGPQAL